MEIDIIAKDHDFFVFVEVKCCSSNCIWWSTNFCFRKKQTFFINATEGYWEMKDLDYEIHFDIISVILGSQKAKIEHFKDAF